MRQWLTALLLTVIAFPSTAGQFKTIKDIEVHYVTFNSTFLTPEIASHYNVKRNGYTALINISVLDTRQPGKPAIEATVRGQAKNLLGQTQTLQFQQVQENQAIYYLAVMPITHEETFTFTLDVDAGLKGAGTLSFTQKFYVDE